MSARSEAVARAYDAWAQDWAGRVQPEEPYASTEPSQYTEGLLALSAPSDAEADLQARIASELTAAGLPVLWTAPSA